MTQGSSFDTERAATILVEAAYKGDKAATAEWGLTTRTLRNWRQRLNTDAAFAELFRQKRAAVEKDWAQDAPQAIRAAIAFIQRAAANGKTTPAMVHAVAGAMKLLADVTLTKQVLDARLAERNRPAGNGHREVAGAGEFSAN